MKEFICYFDGACAPNNPGGHIGMGIMVIDARSETLLHEDSRYRVAAPQNTNNVAEYGALWYLLKWLDDNGHHDASITIRGDSKLVINQMSGEWTPKATSMQNANAHCKELSRKFPSIKFEWVQRTDNNNADALSNRCLIQRGIKLFQR